MTASSPRVRLFALLLALLVARAAHAGGTRSFRQTTARDFEEGEATASMVLPTGDVVPGMKATRIPMDAAFAWCATLSADRRTAYFGTGDQGRIFAVPVARPAGVEPSARKVADVDAAWVTSLVARADGTLVAGSTPGGRIFTVDPKAGTSKVLVKLPAEHVWALVQDARSGTLFAATGGPGKVFAIDAKGTARVLWDSGDKHVVSLADGGGGTLLAGTSDQGIVYRVRPDGRAEALHDFDADEVRAIVRTGTTTYLAVNDFDRPMDLGAPGPAGGAAVRGTRINMAAAAGAPAAMGGLSRGGGQTKARAGVYRLDDDGRIEQVFAMSDGYFTSLLVGDGGEVFAGNGTQGKIYRIGADRTVALAVDLPERQALSLLRTADGFLVGSGDVGGVYRVRAAAAGEATYLSKVFDAEYPARWGALRWSGTGPLAFETRAGNTSKPDKTWTEWRRLDGVSAADREGHVASSPARYLQYRVALPAKDAVLHEVTLYYLPQNQRARITDVSLEAPAAGAAAGPRAHSPVLKLRWKVENPDNDELIYRLWYRPDDDRTWRPLGPTEPLTRAEYDWNTESVPDGRYVVRVWASDERVTPRERALESTFDSVPLLVDNTKPEVGDFKLAQGTLNGRVRDATSVVTQIEYSLDGSEWRPATPADGLLDQRNEAFTIKLPTTAAGPHTVTVRGYDAVDNIGTGRFSYTTNR